MLDPDHGDILRLLVEAVERLNQQLAGPEGLDAAAAGMFCGVSKSKWHELNASGMCPSPAEIGVGRCPRWVRSELKTWMLHGCPSRARWALIRDQAMRKGG